MHESVNKTRKKNQLTFISGISVSLSSKNCFTLGTSELAELKKNTHRIVIV